jgi:hypothetical protein
MHIQYNTSRTALVEHALLTHPVGALQDQIVEFAVLESSVEINDVLVAELRMNSYFALNLTQAHWVHALLRVHFQHNSGP